MSPNRKPAAYGAMEAIESIEALDGPADAISKVVRDAIPRGPVKDALSGTWLGHAFHPLMTDVPIGAWVSALVLDWAGGEESRPAVKRLIGFGLVAAPATFATGWNDWADTTPGNPQVKRLGLLHATSNGTAAALFGASWLARNKGDHGRGKLYALAAGAALGLGGMLGGHLSYSEGVGVDQTVFDPGPAEWTPVLDESQLQDRRPALGRTPDGLDVLLVRDGDRIHALADRCSHRGGALHDGELDGGCIVCPLHGSVFRLEDGSVERGPAAYAQPCYETRVVDERVEVRLIAE